MTQPSGSGARVGTVQVPWPLPQLLVLSAVAFVDVLRLTSYKTFFWDEWTFIVSRRPWDLYLIFLPQNGYWTVIPILVWKVLFVVVGLRSYVPYEVVLLVTHVITVLLLFVLVRRRSGDLPALAASVTLLFLGSGGENIVYAFQINWDGAAAFGLLAMILLDGDPPFPGRVPAVSLALLYSVMCHSIGLAFVAAVFIELATDPSRRRFLLSLVVPVAAFIAWFLAFGTGHSAGSPPISDSLLRGATGPGYVAALASFVTTGVATSAAGIFGLTSTAGPASLAVLAGILGWLWYRQRRIHSWQTGMVGGALTLFALASLGRAEFGPLYATQSRYVYAGAVFLLPLLAHAVSELPWRGLWRPALALAFAVALLGNIVQLHIRAASQIDFMRVEVAELQTVEVFRGAPDMAPHSYIDNSVLPQLQASDYLAATAELGSPVPPASVDSLKNLPPQTVDLVLTNIFGDAVTFKTDNGRSLQGLLCVNVDSTVGSNVDFQVPDAQAVMLQASDGGNAVLFLGLESPPIDQPLRQVHLIPATAEWVQLPKTGKPVTWKLRITTGAVGMVKVCGAAGVEIHESARVQGNADALTPSAVS